MTDITTTRALEIVLSRCRMSRHEANLLKCLLYNERLRSGQPKAPIVDPDTLRAEAYMLLNDLSDIDMSFKKQSMLDRIYAAKLRAKRMISDT